MRAQAQQAQIKQLKEAGKHLLGTHIKLRGAGRDFCSLHVKFWLNAHIYYTLYKCLRPSLAETKGRTIVKAYTTTGSQKVKIKPNFPIRRGGPKPFVGWGLNKQYFVTVYHHAKNSAWTLLSALGVFRLSTCSSTKAFSNVTHTL
jgi:hypothetical protein